MLCFVVLNYILVGWTWLSIYQVLSSRGFEFVIKGLPRGRKISIVEFHNFAYVSLNTGEKH